MGDMDKKGDRYMNRQNRQAKRRWAAGILSAALVLAFGWGCPADGATWFHLQSAKAYEGGTLVVQEGPEVPLASVPVIKEGGANTSQGYDQGTEATGGLSVLPEGGTQQSENESNQGLVTDGGSRTVSALEEEIVRAGGAYAQVLNGNTAIYTTSQLNDWFAMVDVGIVYATYYYVTDGWPDAVQVTFNSDYGIVMGYMYAGDLGLLDKDSTVRLLMDVSQVDTYFDAGRTLPLAWVWYVPKGAEGMINTGSGTESQPTIDWNEVEEYNPENILSVVTEETTNADNTTYNNEETGSEWNDLSILAAGDEGTSNTTETVEATAPAEEAAPAPAGLVDIGSVLGSLVPGLQAAESETVWEPETILQDDAQQSTESPEEAEGEKAPVPSEVPVVNSTAVLEILIPGLAAQTDETSEENTEETGEIADETSDTTEDTEDTVDETDETETGAEDTSEDSGEAADEEEAAEETGEEDNTSGEAADASDEEEAADENEAGDETDDEDETEDTVEEENGDTEDETGVDETADETEAQQAVLISMNIGEQVTAGQTIEITGSLVGYEDLEYTLQWQYNDGTGWCNVEGANALVHSFTLDAMNYNWLWQLLVEVVD